MLEPMDNLNNTIEDAAGADSAKERIKELTLLLNRASESYYNHDTEIMSNFEYDRLYDELSALEKSTGIVMAGSPTVHVGYAAAQELPKERHETPMLSLDKTKDRDALAQWLSGHEGLLSLKLDGLTVVLTYEGGRLVKAVTRGNGEVGEVITDNAKVFVNLPVQIPCTDPILIRGEAVIRYSDFAAINEELEAEALTSGDLSFARYKNPRNLCSGSVRQLNNEVTAKRRVRFYAFSLVQAGGRDFGNSRENQLLFLREQGFEIAEYVRVTPENVADAVGRFEKEIAHQDLPSDGLVLTLDDIAYGESLGTTAKFPRNSIAFKWADEISETTLTDVEWSASRTGLINPVAVFEPVELEGTTVKRASVHNVSIVRELKLGIGDRITVYKANMIIPQISENLTKSGNFKLPDACPACGGEVVVKNENGTETLNCINPICPAKNIKLFTLFVSRNAMNIDGMSEATMETFIDHGLLRGLSDIYHLKDYKEKIVALEGFGEKSYNKLVTAIEESRKADMAGFLYGLGIPGFGVANAKLVVKAYKSDINAIMNATEEELVEIDQVGNVLASDFVSYFSDESKKAEVEKLLNEIEFVIEENTSEQDLEGMTFVITGSLETYPNRDALKKEIEDRGGKVAGSVSAKTTCLINNDITSNSSKNKKAKSLDIPIITEEMFKNKQFT